MVQLEDIELKKDVRNAQFPPAEHEWSHETLPLEDND